MCHWPEKVEIGWCQVRAVSRIYLQLHSIEFLQLLSVLLEVWGLALYCWNNTRFLLTNAGIFLFKLCTFDPIVHIIIQNSSHRPLVQVKIGEHPRNSTKRRASPLLRSFCALPPVVQVARDLTTDMICLDYVRVSEDLGFLRFGESESPSIETSKSESESDS